MSRLGFCLHLLHLSRPVAVAKQGSPSSGCLNLWAFVLRELSSQQTFWFSPILSSRLTGSEQIFAAACGLWLLPRADNRTLLVNKHFHFGPKNADGTNEPQKTQSYPTSCDC